MNLGSVLFSAKGRIGQKTFAIVFAPIFIISTVLSYIVQANPEEQRLAAITVIVALVLLYPSICIYSKRLHDMGRSGWLQLVLYGVALAFGIFVASRSVGATMSAAMGAQGDPEAARAAVLAAAAELRATDPVVRLQFPISIAISLAWALWLGLTPGNPGANKYGPPEGEEEVSTSVV